MARRRSGFPVGERGRIATMIVVRTVERSYGQYSCIAGARLPVALRSLARREYDRVGAGVPFGFAVAVGLGVALTSEPGDSGGADESTDLAPRRSTHVAVCPGDRS
jgi:hypothetical protein